MAKHSHVSKYYADDKDILDLMSAGKMTKVKLHEFARSRGIFVSPEEPESSLVDYLHTLACSRDQLNDLLAVIDSPDREEKVTSRKVETDADADRLQTACQAVRDDRSARNAEEYTITKFTEDHIQVQVRYSEIDHQRTRLLQRRDKTLTIEIHRAGGRLEVRHQDNARATDVVKSLMKHLAGADEKEPQQQVISLSGIRIPKLRNDFFVNLMEGLTGHDLDDVLDVKVDKLSIAEEEESAPDAENSSEVEEKEALESELKRVTLSGRGLLYSPEYQRLVKSEFFISRAIWVCKERKDGGGGDKVELHAEFGDADAGEGFRYSVRGIWKRNEDGDFPASKAQPDPIARAKLLNLLETSADASLEKITQEASTGGKATSPDTDQ